MGCFLKRHKIPNKYRLYLVQGVNDHLIMFLCKCILLNSQIQHLISHFWMQNTMMRYVPQGPRFSTLLACSQSPSCNILFTNYIYCSLNPGLLFRRVFKWPSLFSANLRLFRRLGLTLKGKGISKWPFLFLVTQFSKICRNCMSS